jgi:iron complex outermembrane receptor protein
LFILLRVIVAMLLILIPATAGARQAAGAQADTVSVHPLETLVVTAERSSIPVALSTAAVSVLGGSELHLRPVRTLTEALQQTPGLAFIDFDGLGRDPQIMVRGFYGGGEAEYVVVLLDGRPINDAETGRVPWDLVPLSAIESVEVVRGSASAAWGDAALGGVIRLTTKQSRDPVLRTSLTGGEHGLVRASASMLNHWSNRPVSFYGDVSRSDGFRAHAERETGGFGVSLGLLDAPDRSLSVFTTNDWRNFDEPGPLALTELTQSREQSSPFYRFDTGDERRHRLGIEGSTGVGARNLLTGSLTGDYRRTDRIRTLPLVPTFADTKNRVLTSTRLIGSAQLEQHGLLGDDHLVLGGDAAIGRVRSEYYGFHSGPPQAYTNATPQRGDLEERGAVRRTTLAGFFHYGFQAAPALRFTLGARVDGLRDTFEADPPSEPAERSASHTAFSPKAGVNVQYANSTRHRGHAYVNATRAFKAPTPDQLFDQRTVPVPFPPFAITFANDELRPQYASSMESGLYHHVAIAPALAAEVTLAVYHMDLRDEIDFDVATLSYRNIGKSRHRGVEAGVRLFGPASLSASASYTLQAPTARTGDYKGKHLKAIPRHFLSGGVSTTREAGLGASLLASSARGMYLDDANTREIPDWTRWDARVSYGVRRLRLWVDVFNLFDSRYSTTGFLDPSGTEVEYFHPAAGRTLQVGISREW